jgi:glycosyltransferase involved in cell wall biosynthesis
MEEMKVLLATHFSYDPHVGGPAHTVADIACKLNESGVVASLRTGDGRRLPPPGGLAPLGDLLRVDLVHNFGMWTAGSHGVSLAARLIRKPLVLAPLGNLEPWALKQKALKKRAAWFLYQKRDLDRAEVVHATSVGEAESVRALRVRSPIALIPHAVDVPADVSDNGSKHVDGPRTALFLSRIHPKKGLLELVKAWSRLRPKNWRVVVAGPDEGGHRAQVEAEVARHSLQSAFTFLGSVSPAMKCQLLRQADLFVLPTYSENFGLVVPEALARGTPVLTTRGAPWSDLEETNSGWWIDVGADPLTRALEGVLPLSRPALAEMGRRGRQLVIDRYSWKAIIDQHVELYRWMAGSGSMPKFMFA